MSPTVWENEKGEDGGWFFIEFPGFSKERDEYFPEDEDFQELQAELVEDPTKGTAMPQCGGVRKLRRPDVSRGKGKRGGLRIIYLQVPEAQAIVLLDVYNKEEQDDLSAKEKKEICRLAHEIRKTLIARYGRRASE